MAERSVVLPGIGRPRRLATWIETLAEEVDDLVVVVADERDRLAATTAAAGRPSVSVLRVEAASWADLADHGLRRAVGDVAILLRVDVRPEAGWTTDLADALVDGVGMAQPILLDADFVVHAAGGGTEPLLAGQPVADAERLAGLDLPGPWPGAVAVRRGEALACGGVGSGEADLAGRLEAAGGGVVRLAPDVRLRTRGDEVAGPVARPGEQARVEAAWRRAGYDAPHGRPLAIREGRPVLRWSLDIAAGAGRFGRAWGDYAFARSLANALGRLGQWVAIDHPQTRHRASSVDDDVLLTIRGLDRVPPRPQGVNLMWLISHPELVSEEECAGYDTVFAASRSWASGHAGWARDVRPLLQCTDPSRFHPGLAAADTGPGLLFVGNSRGVMRPSVALARAAGLPLTVIGRGWPEEVTVADSHVPNDELGALYASAGIVLNDHWEDMRAEGFISNRVFDVLACGGRLLSDDVAGLHDVLGEAVLTWSSPTEFARLAADPGHWPDTPDRLAVAERVLVEHSFDARARELIDVALRLRAGVERPRP